LDRGNVAFLEFIYHYNEACTQDSLRDTDTLGSFCGCVCAKPPEFFFVTVMALLTSIFRRNLRVKYTRLFLLYFTVVKLGPCVKIYLSAFEVSITGVLAACAV
jgi:hypothetical protein